MAVLTETKTQPGALGRTVCFGDESVGKLLPRCSDCGPGAVLEQYKSRTFPSLSHPLLQFHLVGKKVSVEPFPAFLWVLLVPFLLPFLFHLVLLWAF